jgi:SsrA-binding protein
MSSESIKLVARNRKARHQYHILETWEAGLVLTGSEVKALRQGSASLSDAHKVEQAGLTLIPLEIYFRDGVAKMKLALARGKRQKDRREDIKRREADREMGRARKNR